MTIAVGDKLPQGEFLIMTDDGPGTVKLADRVNGKKTVIFGLPGPFTGTCTDAHVPSFVRTAEAFRAKGVDHIICFAHADPFIMKEWGRITGGTDAGIEFLADGDGSFTRALGLAFDAPVIGFYGRTKRHSLYAEDGVVKQLNFEDKAGVCEMTAGEILLEQI